MWLHTDELELGSSPYEFEGTGGTKKHVGSFQMKPVRAILSLALGMGMSCVVWIQQPRYFSLSHLRIRLSQGPQIKAHSSISLPDYEFFIPRGT
jgi:hypothetical protein